MNGAAKAGLYDLKVGLLATVQELHMNLTGASDAGSAQEMINMRNAIMVAVNTWEASHSFSKKYDDAVKALCHAVLDEAFELDKQALFVR